MNGEKGLDTVYRLHRHGHLRGTSFLRSRIGLAQDTLQDHLIEMSIVEAAASE